MNDYVAVVTTHYPVLTPQTFDQLMTFADMAAKSDMVPKDFKGKPGNIVLAVQMGAELGLSPMQSLSSIAVINGRPGVWGDGLIGICRQSPLCQDIIEWTENEGDEMIAYCTAKRRGATDVTARFSVVDARKAGLWGKDIWAKYPARMLQNRARGFALRDQFPDLLRGLKTIEELRDTPRDDYRGTTLEGTAEPAPRQQQQQQRPTHDAAASYATSRAAPETKKPQAKRTWGEWLDDLKVKLAAASTMDELNEIASSREVMAALKSDALITPNLRRDLDAMLSDAHERLATNEPPNNDPPHDSQTGKIIDDDTFPGDL